MKTSLLAGGLALALFSIQPIANAHCYSVWRYPTPQHCGVAHAPQPDRSYYVEIVETPPVQMALDADQRTPEEIKDFDEHYIELEKHKNEINALMLILRTNEALDGR